MLHTRYPLPYTHYSTSKTSIMKNLKFLTLSALCFVFLFSSCRKFIEGDGPIVQESIQVPAFTGVILAGGFDVIVTLGDVQSVVAEGHQNIIDRLQTNITSDGSLKLDLENGRYRHYDLVIYVTVPEADKFRISGAGDMTIYQDTQTVMNDLDIEITGAGNMKGVGPFLVNNRTKARITGAGNMNFVIDTDLMDVNITGSGDMYFDLFANRMDAEITGAGDISLDGAAAHQDIRILGSGDYNAYNFLTQSTFVRITGSGDVECSVDTELEATITGSGSVFYKGSPTVDVNISGSGSVKHVN